MLFLYANAMRPLLLLSHTPPLLPSPCLLANSLPHRMSPRPTAHRIAHTCRAARGTPRAVCGHAVAEGRGVEGGGAQLLRGCALCCPPAGYAACARGIPALALHAAHSRLPGPLLGACGLLSLEHSELLAQRSVLRSVQLAWQPPPTQLAMPAGRPPLVLTGSEHTCTPHALCTDVKAARLHGRLTRLPGVACQLGMAGDQPEPGAPAGN